MLIWSLPFEVCKSIWVLKFWGPECDYSDYLGSDVYSISWSKPFCYYQVFSKLDSWLFGVFENVDLTLRESIAKLRESPLGFFHHAKFSYTFWNFSVPLVLKMYFLKCGIPLCCVVWLTSLSCRSENQWFSVAMVTYLSSYFYFQKIDDMTRIS